MSWGEGEVHSTVSYTAAKVGLSECLSDVLNIVEQIGDMTIGSRAMQLAVLTTRTFGMSK